MRDTIKIYSTNIHLKTNKKYLKRNQTCKFVPDHVFNIIRRHYNITTVFAAECCKFISFKYRHCR